MQTAHMLKTIAVTVLLCILPPSWSLAHPGKTDRYGGHTCLKDCEEWKLSFEEYHLHDKYGRPIRVPKRHARHRSSVQTAPSTTHALAEPATAVTKTVFVQSTVLVQEDLSFLPNPYLYLLLLLLIALLAYRMNRRSEE